MERGRCISNWQKIPELTQWQTISSDSTDYLLGGALTLKNGRIDMYQFEEGYCQATRYNATQDNFTFLYYDKDHLGNVLSRRYFNVTVTI